MWGDVGWRLPAVTATTRGQPGGGAGVGWRSFTEDEEVDEGEENGGQDQLADEEASGEAEGGRGRWR